MASQKTILDEIKREVRKRKTETGEANAVARVLALYNHTKLPQVFEGRSADGMAVRTYVFEDTPAGTFFLVTGPSVEGEIETQFGPAAKSLAEAGLWVQGTKATSKTARSVVAGMTKASSKVIKSTVAAPAKKKAAPKATKKKAAPRKKAATKRAAPVVVEEAVVVQPAAQASNADLIAAFKAAMQ